MHEPTPAALLGGVIGSLESDVLPALDTGVAQRQLKAALVILRRLERAAGGEAVYLDEEAADVAATLGHVLASASDDASAELARRVAAIAAAAAGPDLIAARERDTKLQALAVEVEQHLHAVGYADGAAALRRLHGRMLARQDAAWGTASPPR